MWRWRSFWRGRVCWSLLACVAGVLLTAAARGAVDAAVPADCAWAASVLKEMEAQASAPHDSATQTLWNIVLQIGPACRQAIAKGQWPAFARTLLARASSDDALKSQVCELELPEAMDVIVTWEKAIAPPGATYEETCAVALARHRPPAFEAIVVPQLIGANDPFGEASRIAGRLRPDERSPLLPVLALADRTHAQGRDELYRLICEGEPARSAAACRSAPNMESGWNDRTRLHNFFSGSAAFLVGAILYVLLVGFLRRRYHEDWPAVTMSVIGSMATAASLTWFAATEQLGSKGETGWILVGLALVAMPIAALVAALLTWAMFRKLRHLALPWCMVQAVAFLAFTLPVIWKYAAP